MPDDKRKTEVLEPRVLDPRPVGESAAVDRHRSAMEQCATIEDGIYTKSHRVVSDFLDFRDVDPNEPEKALAKWIADGMEPGEADRRMALALAGWDKVADMPAGVKMANEQFVSITKARSKVPESHVEMHATFVTVQLPPAEEYPEILEEG